MSLRISKKEREEINKLNIRAKRKATRLYKTYGLINTFKIKKIPEFTTRKEFNTYKHNLNKFLLRTSFHFVKGGTYFSQRKSDFGKSFYYPIEMEQVKKWRKILRKRNAYINKILKSMEHTPYYVGKQNMGYSTRFVFNNRVNPNRYGRLNERYSSFFPVTFQPKNISSKQSEANFDYAIRKFQNKENILKKQLTFKENTIQALLNTFGRSALPIIEILEDMDITNFINFYESNPDLDIGYIYDIVQANNVLKAYAEHLLNYTKDKKYQVDSKSQQKLELMLELDSNILLQDYNVGSKGGQRIIFKKLSDKVNRVLTYYVDLTPEEYENYLTNYDITQIDNFEDRIRQLNIRK